jgi:hypothetical protein
MIRKNFVSNTQMNELPTTVTENADLGTPLWGSSENKCKSESKIQSTNFEIALSLTLSSGNFHNSPDLRKVNVVFQSHCARQRHPSGHEEVLLLSAKPGPTGTLQPLYRKPH